MYSLTWVTIRHIDRHYKVKSVELQVTEEQC